MSRSNFQTTGTKLHIHIFVFNNWDGAVDQRNQHPFAFQVCETWIVWIHTNSGIAQNRFRTGCCDCHESPMMSFIICCLLITALNLVFQVIEFRLHFAVNHLFV